MTVDRSLESMKTMLLVPKILVQTPVRIQPIREMEIDCDTYG